MPVTWSIYGAELFLVAQTFFSSKTNGPGEEGTPRNHPEISSQKLADLHHFGPFWEKDFGAISGGPFFSRPLCFTAEKSV